MGCVMNFSEYVEIFRNLSLAIAAPFGAWVAYKGLNAWQHENRWNVDNELALNIYRSFRQRKEIYHYIRTPNLDPPVLHNEEIETMILEERAKGNRIRVLKLYWQALHNIKVRQSEFFDEAQLRWDTDYYKMSEGIRDLEHELAIALEDLQAAGDGSFQPDSDVKAEIDEIASSYRDRAGRKTQYNDIFGEIEASLKLKIVGPSKRSAKT